MGGMNPIVLRVACGKLAEGLRVQHILRDGRPYLDRYFVAGWDPVRKRPGPAVFLHHFVASDAASEVHSHPWAWSLSLILAGGYREIRCLADGRSEVRTYEPGSVNVLAPEDKHRIELLEGDCWTLFLAGEFARPWAFEAAC